MVKLTVVPVIPLALSEAMKTATLSNRPEPAFVPWSTSSGRLQHRGAPFLSLAAL
jgi:hypothetical protein